jgi:hypothetical protein
VQGDEIVCPSLDVGTRADLGDDETDREAEEHERQPCGEPVGRDVPVRAFHYGGPGDGNADAPFSATCR